MPKKKSGKPIPPAARAKARSARSQPASQRSLDADEPKAFAELRYFAEADPGLARECTQLIDVVCHSRGGLVAAWWLRLSRRDVAHVIVVGAPLAGTTLASPAALRQALDHLATAVKGMTVVGSLASTVMPFMTILTGLTEILGKVLQLGADLPIADVAVVSVPALPVSRASETTRRCCSCSRHPGLRSRNCTRWFRTSGRSRPRPDGASGAG